MADAQQSGFIWYDLMTDDLDKAVAFYSAVVGWEILDEGTPESRYLLFGKAGRPVGGMMSWSALGMTQPTMWKGHLLSRDLQAEIAALQADGATQHRAPQEIPGVGRFAVMADPQGAEFLLFQPVGGAPAQLDREEPGAVGWHELSTTDWERAWEFYSRHFGWAKGTAVGMGEMGVYQTMMLSGDQGGGMMNIPAALAGKMQPAWLFYFTVHDIQKGAERVKTHGGTVTHGPAQVPGGSWMLQATDPQGGAFALTAAQ